MSRGYSDGVVPLTPRMRAVLAAALLSSLGWTEALPARLVLRQAMSDLEPVYKDGQLLGYRARDRAAWEAPIARVDRAPVDAETMSQEAILEALDLWTPGPP